MENKRTSRLNLVPGTAQSASLELVDLTEFARLLGADVPTSWPLVPARVTEMWARELENQDQIGWRNWYFVRHDSPRVLVGGGGFKGLPNEQGVVEIGYSVAPEFGNQGYATEGIGGLIRWAFEQQPVKKIIAQTLPDNLASIRVLEKNGFVRAGAELTENHVLYELISPK